MDKTDSERLAFLEKKAEEHDRRFDAHDKRFDEHDKRFDAHDKRFDEHDKRFDEHDKRFDVIERKLDQNSRRIDAVADDLGEFRAEVEERFDEITVAIQAIQRSQNALTTAFVQAMREYGVSKSLERRVKRLEDSVFGKKS